MELRSDLSGLELISYVEWLIENNRTNTGESDLSQFTVTYGFGLIEEYGEFMAEVGNVQARAKEAGDVLAYTVLLLHALFGLPYEQIAEVISNNKTYTPAIGANVASYLKRTFRGDLQTIEEEREFIKLLREQLTWVMLQTELDLETIALINKQKLEKRLSATGTFQGKGDR
jgi:NTP pyrophosphatase (non-canonical NTP hydrolase)